MAQQPREHRPGQGNLLMNKKTNDKQPDYYGSLTLDHDYRAGETIRLSAWKKASPYGHLISLSVNNYKKDMDPKPVVKDDNEVPF